MDELIKNIKNWAEEKNLLKRENSKTQMLKVLEEHLWRTCSQMF